MAWNPLTIHGHNATHEWWCPNLTSLCLLRVLCVSVVSVCSRIIHHRDTEDTEVSQRILTTQECRFSCLPGVAHDVIVDAKLIQVFLS